MSENKNIKFVEYKNLKRHKWSIRRTYVKAFPREERAPFSMINTRAKDGKADFLIAMDGNEFVGFAYMVANDVAAYLFYLVVREDKRGMGYGSAILRELFKRYQGRKIFLAREQLDETAPNYEQRLNRHAFYEHNGFVDIPAIITEAGVTYDVMSDGNIVTHDEYDELIVTWSGREGQIKYGLALHELI